MATINGTFNSLIAGTLSGTVATPGAQGPVGPQGPQGPAGPPGTGGVWGSITGTLSSQTDLQNALDAKQNVSGMTAYLTKAGNLSGLTDLATARDNLQLGVLYSPTFAGLTVQGAGANVANLTPTSLSLNHATSGSFVIQPSSGITFPDTTIQTTAFNATAMLPYALIDSQVFTGTPSLPAGTIGVTAALGDNDTSLATTAFVQQELLSGTANARNLEVLVRNQTGSTIPAGSIVYVSGATGNLPLVTLAQGNNDANSAQTMGFVKTAIANNGTGFVIVRGIIENLDTSALTEGVQLYLSPTTPGAWTTTKPVAPNHMVYVGIVIRSHPTQGTILVAVQNGLELEELHDVLITSPTNGQVLKYDSVSGLWKNGTDVGGVAWGGITGTLSSQTDLQNALDAKSDLSGATFTGKVNFTPVAGVAGLNVGIGGTSAASTTNGDLWITTGGANLNFRDGTGAWKVLAALSNGNVFSAVQAVDVNSTLTALRVTQRGTGNAIEVEDSTTPDATRFVVDQHGKVGIGVAPDVTAALKVDANGIMFNDGTTQTTAPVAAPVTSVAGKIGAVTLFNTDISGLGTIATVNDAPSDGSTYGRNNGAWTLTGGVDYQEFTTAGTFTWTKPAGAKWVDVIMFGGGAGGGAGGRYATSSARSGGAGGGGGTVLAARISASLLGSTQTVVVGAGGTAGTSATTDTTAGGNGGIGGNSTFSIFQAAGGSAGSGGSTTAPAGGPGRSAWIYGTSPAAVTSGSGGAGALGAGVAGGTVISSNSYMASGGGGGGGQAAAVTTATAGGAGGSKTAGGVASGLISAVSGGSAGTTGGTPPTAGVAGAANTGGTGGGGGAYITGVIGMAGALGGFPGGGGGGGAASDNGFASGAGGAGAGGAVYIITYS